MKQRRWIDGKPDGSYADARLADAMAAITEAVRLGVSLAMSSFGHREALERERADIAARREKATKRAGPAMLALREEDKLHEWGEPVSVSQYLSERKYPHE